MCGWRLLASNSKGWGGVGWGEGSESKEPEAWALHELCYHELSKKEQGGRGQQIVAQTAHVGAVSACWWSGVQHAVGLCSSPPPHSSLVLLSRAGS